MVVIVIIIFIIIFITIIFWKLVSSPEGRSLIHLCVYTHVQTTLTHKHPLVIDKDPMLTSGSAVPVRVFANLLWLA